ncbi:preprotein translocase subunit SecE [Patescibacteria group bacterium]
MDLKNSAIAKYVMECYDELKKVVWPSKKDVKNHTWVVIVLCLIVAAFLGFVDYIFAMGLEKFIIR